MRQVLGCALFRPPAHLTKNRKERSAAARGGSGAAAVSPRLLASAPDASPRPHRTISEGARSLESADRGRH